MVSSRCGVLMYRAVLSAQCCTAQVLTHVPNRGKPQTSYIGASGCREVSRWWRLFKGNRTVEASVRFCRRPHFAEWRLNHRYERSMPMAAPSCFARVLVVWLPVSAHGAMEHATDELELPKNSLAQLKVARLSAGMATRAPKVWKLMANNVKPETILFRPS